LKTALLLSGGMDSLSIAWWKNPDLAFTVDYGQLAAEAEITAAKAMTDALKIPHHVIDLNCRALGSGDMAGGKPDANAPASDWWPYRNQLIATLTAMKAIGFGVTHLWFGTVKSDENHTDGTQAFFDAMNALMVLQEGNIIIEAPAISLNTSELIKVSGIPAGKLAWAHSCHKANIPCGDCRGCNKYFQVYEEVGYGLEKIR